MVNKIEPEFFLEEVLDEVKRAKSLFPKTNDIWGAFDEEAGEVAKALIQHKHELNKKVRHEDIYEELVQLCAMVVRVATEGDTNYPYDPKSGTDPNWEGYVKNPYELEEEWKISFIEKYAYEFIGEKFKLVKE